MVSGCSKNEATPTIPLPVRFESDFNADFGRLTLCGHISKLETGIYEIIITAPESLEKLRINYIGGQLTSTLDGISFDINTENSPVSGFVTRITGLLDSISKSANTVITATEDYNKYSVIYQDNTSYILQEKKSGSITSLVIESSDISMNFINFKKD